MMATSTTYAIAVLRNVYSPDTQGDRTVRFIGSDNHPEEHTTYNTIDAAQETIDNMEGET
jgi:hypothetical protein